MNHPDPDLIAETVGRCPSVVGLSGGPLGTVATYLPGRRVTGVRIDGSAVEVHVVGKWGVPVPELASEIRAAVAPRLDGHTLEVVIEDVSDPELVASESTVAP